MKQGRAVRQLYGTVLEVGCTLEPAPSLVEDARPGPGWQGSLTQSGPGVLILVGGVEVRFSIEASAREANPDCPPLYN